MGAGTEEEEEPLRWLPGWLPGWGKVAAEALGPRLETREDWQGSDCSQEAATLKGQREKATPPLGSSASVSIFGLNSLL